MNERKMPVVFSGHGSPMLALEHSNATKELKRIGDTITAQYEGPDYDLTSVYLLVKTIFGNCW